MKAALPSFIAALLLSGCAALIPVAEIGIEVAARYAERALAARQAQAAAAGPQVAPAPIAPDDLLERGP